VDIGIDAFVKLGWSVADTEERHAVLSDLTDFIADRRPHGPLTAGRD
jgi:hypothetical protein